VCFQRVERGRRTPTDRSCVRFLDGQIIITSTAPVDVKTSELVYSAPRRVYRCAFRRIPPIPTVRIFLPFLNASARNGHHRVTSIRRRFSVPPAPLSRAKRIVVDFSYRTLLIIDIYMAYYARYFVR